MGGLSRAYFYNSGLLALDKEEVSFVLTVML